MAKATTFYLPIFKTGLPSSKLYTYISETNTLTPTYSDVDGTLNTNPIIMDEKGECTLYINEDIDYRYVLFDNDDNLIYDIDNIKSLKGIPGTPGGPKGETGDRGRRGNQGQSGELGLPGLPGVTGDQGPDYLNKISFQVNGSYTIPKGYEECYITATAGGGAAASWSEYVFIFNAKDTSITFTRNLSPVSRVTASGANLVSLNPMKFETISWGGLIFIPGSGYSGQSFYRRKFSLNKDIENKIDIVIGTGGLPNKDGLLDGNDGLDTLIYINNALAYTLKGGKGGKNYFPKNNSTIPTLPTDGTPIRLNAGSSTGLIFLKTNSTDNNIDTPAAGNASFVWNTSYKKTNGTTFINTPIQLSYITPILSNLNTNVLYNQQTTKSINNVFGASNIFGSYYTTYQNKSNPGNGGGNLGLQAVKNGLGDFGWGSGGDTFYNFNTNQDFPINLLRPLITNTLVSGQSRPVSFFNKTDVKNKIIEYMNNFRVSDSFSTGVNDIPSLNDPIFSYVDATEQLAINPNSYIQIAKNTFQNEPLLVDVTIAKNSIGDGGPGVKGYAIIEYGSIKEN